MKQPVAIVFDTFGSVVDWRGSLIDQLAAFGARRGIDHDWAGLADDWRTAYPASMQRVLKGETAWTKLEALQRHSIEEIALARGLADLTPADLDEINLFWRRCRAWPDSVAGLERLRHGFVVAPLSNGDVALLVEMAKTAGLAWDMVFSTELFHSFKPHPSTYLGACELLGLAPAQVMMCAAHNSDLAAAHALGLKTAFISRPTEYGPAREAVATGHWEYSVDSLTQLADRLGC